MMNSIRNFDSELVRQFLNTEYVSIGRSEKRKKGRRILLMDGEKHRRGWSTTVCVVSVRRKGRIAVSLTDLARCRFLSQAISLEVSRTCGCQVENINSNKSGLRSVVAYIAKVGLIPLQ